MRDRIKELEDRLQDRDARIDHLSQAESKLTDDLREAQQRVGHAQTDGARAQAGKNTIVVARQRKIDKFSGAEDAQENVELWVEEVRRFLRDKTWEESEKVDFILEHLSGSAKEDIQYRDEATKGDSVRILGVLQQVFGVKAPLARLQEMFYARYQEPGESLLEYSIQLMKVLSAISHKMTLSEGDKNQMLKSKFKVGIRDVGLARELEKVDTTEPDLPFWEFREKAVKWVGITDSGKKGANVRVISSQPVTNADSTHTQSDPKPEASAPPSDKFDKMFEMMALQHQETVKLNQTLASFVTNQSRQVSTPPVVQGGGDRPPEQAAGYSKPRDQRGWRSGFNEFGQMVCFGCGSTEHRKFECPHNERNRGQGQRSRPNQRQGSGQNRPAPDSNLKPNYQQSV